MGNGYAAPTELYRFVVGFYKDVAPTALYDPIRGREVFARLPWVSPTATHVAALRAAGQLIDERWVIGREHLSKWCGNNRNIGQSMNIASLAWRRAWAYFSQGARGLRSPTGRLAKEASRRASFRGLLPLRMPAMAGTCSNSGDLPTKSKPSSISVGSGSR